MTIKISGVEDIQRELGDIVTKQKIDEALEKSAILVKAEAQRYCPVRTNYLHNSIVEIKIDDYTWRVMASADYADYIEYGTFRIPAGTPENPLIYTSSAGKYPSYRPYLRSALYDCTERIQNIFDKVLNEGQQSV